MYSLISLLHKIHAKLPFDLQIFGQLTKAITLSKENYRENISKIQRATTIEFKQVNGFAHDALEKMMLQGNKGFDLIVSNPPYITSDEYKHLDPDVKQWEDSRALVAEEQEQEETEKSRIPRLVMEFGGTHQVEPLKQMMSDKNLFQDIEIWKDLAGKDRVIVGI
ncbi:hypothetical protein BDC45DRAFT_566142 [Circinella umbellata]|nr:hypothetical protein BDC45DRAFT_566142 [Circinella umbellata]